MGLHSVSHFVRAQLTLRVSGTNYKKRAVNFFFKKKGKCSVELMFLHPHIFSFFVSSYFFIFVSGFNYD